LEVGDGAFPIRNGGNTRGIGRRGAGREREWFDGLGRPASKSSASLIGHFRALPKLAAMFGSPHIREAFISIQGSLSVPNLAGFSDKGWNQ